MMHAGRQWRWLTLCVIVHVTEMASKNAAATLSAMTPASSCLQTRRLPDGTLVTLRAVRPSDVDSLQRAFDALSSETRYQRFHAHISELSQPLWRYLTEVDGRDHVALVARVGARMVGVARFIRLSEAPDGAELAIVVADDLQRRGLGRQLVGALVDEARRRGVEWFQAAVLPDNVGIRRLLTAPPLSFVSDTGDRLVVRIGSASADKLAGSDTTCAG